MQTIDLPLTLGGIDFAYRFENEKYIKKNLRIQSRPWRHFVVDALHAVKIIRSVLLLRESVLLSS